MKQKEGRKEGNEKREEGKMLKDGMKLRKE